MKRKPSLRRWLRLPRIRSNRARVLLINGVFAALMSVAVFAARDPAGLLEWKSAGHGKGIQVVKTPGLLGASSLAGDDPVLHFDKTKVGQVMISSAHSDSCRRVLFDNRTGARLEAGEVFCGQTPEQPSDADSSQRMLSLKKAFQR